MGMRMILFSTELLGTLLTGGGMPVVSNAPKDLRVVGVDLTRSHWDRQIALICSSDEWSVSASWPEYFEPEMQTTGVKTVERV